MNTIITFSLVALLSMTSVFGQSNVSTQQMSLDGTFESRLLRSADSWYVRCSTRSAPGTHLRVFSPDLMQTQLITGDPSIPFADATTHSICAEDGNVWLGLLNRAVYSIPGSEWHEIDLTEDGREVDVHRLSPLAGVGVLASLTSYVVDRIDSSGGVVLKWTSQQRGEIKLLSTGSEPRLLYTDSSRRFPFTNVVRTVDDRLAFAFTRTGNDASYMALLSRDGNVQEISSPGGMPNNVSATSIASDDAGKLYVFYGPSYNGGLRSPAFVAIYDMATASTSLVYVHSGGTDASNAVMSRVGLLASVPNGVLAIVGASARHVPIPGPNGANLEDILDCQLVDQDTLMVVDRTGISKVPLGMFATSTSVAPTTRHNAVAGVKIGLDGLIDISISMQWALVDDLGRVVLQGETVPGQTEIDLRDAKLPVAPLTLLLSANGRTLRIQRFLHH